jgi:hypothetical protein
MMLAGLPKIFQDDRLATVQNIHQGFSLCANNLSLETRKMCGPSDTEKVIWLDSISS